MPGFLGGSSGSSGAGGEIRFPAEFIDPVTKLRVSQPETLIDTDFEYGLQPTKWETVETINNTPSFFSKSGDTTIPNITAVVTNSGTREITVTTALEHGLSVGIPISVTGTKSVTADGTYIINSIPNTTTFTYLCRDNQPNTASIEDLYTSIITGEFFQGSQIRISDADGMTTDGEAISVITVKTPSPHGFKVNTPFYFLNLNSTISQEFQAANTAAKSFDASNSATAQTFDGSNTQSSIAIDFSNSAVVGGTVSTISGSSAAADTISVSHTTENFQGKPIGTPLYYNVTTGSGYFFTNPRGVVFLKTNGTLGTLSSTFQVSAVPDGDVIDITASITGTFQLANQARTFAGNNVNTATETVVTIVNDPVKTFDGTNTGDGTGTVTSGGVSGQNITVTSTDALQNLWYTGAMVLYTTDGSAATGLVNNTTYFINNFFQQGTSSNYTFDLKDLPTGAVKTGLSGGTGTQTFKKIGISLDKDVIHVKNHGYVSSDMLRYDYPAGGRFSVGSLDQEKDFYFVSTVYDAHNFTVNQVIGEITPLTQSRTGTDAGTSITPVTFTAEGFGSGIVWSVASGTLPSGLTLNTSTGTISGTPSNQYNTANVVIQATDAAGTSSQATVTFQFNPSPAIYAFTSATFTPGGASRRYGPDINQARSGVGNPSWASTYLQMPQVQGVQQWTVPQTATYTIVARGANGGSGSGQGGSGAIVTATVNLAANDRINIVCGQPGSPYGGGQDGGGGGGSFVSTGATYTSSTLLVAAGGGGGGGSAGVPDGMHGMATQNGGGAYGGSNGNGAPNGSGSENGSGGGGWFGQGSGNDFGRQVRSSSQPIGGGSVYGDGSNVGGFAGGAGGWGSGGGGGGYSGGSPVMNAGQNRSGSGGGGSFVGNGANQVSIARAGSGNYGNGSVTITRN